MRRVLAVSRKELLHILRDRRSLAIAVLMPLMMLLLYGFVIDLELKDLRVAVIDLDRTPASRSTITDLVSSGFIVDAGRLSSRDEIEPGFRRNRFQAALIVPKGFGESLAKGESAAVQVIVDGADGSTAATVDNYINAGLILAAHKGRVDRGAAAPPPIDPRIRIYFNPELKSTHFIVPGLVAVVLTMICALLTSISLTREKETGTLEQMLTTPVGSGQIIVGKLLPYLILGSIDAAIVLVLGRIVFKVPMEGSWLALSAYSLLFVLISLSLGLLISALASTQRVAMMAALVATFLPALILSGFVFAHSSMPLALQLIGQLVPATHYLVIIRGIMLKGQEWFPRQTGILFLMLVFLVAVSIRKSRKVQA
jgi:ABC-2 type transport system permease protein